MHLAQPVPYKKRLAPRTRQRPAPYPNPLTNTAHMTWGPRAPTLVIQLVVPSRMGACRHNTNLHPLLALFAAPTRPSSNRKDALGKLSSKPSNGDAPEMTYFMRLSADGNLYMRALKKQDMQAFIQRATNGRASVPGVRPADPQLLSKKSIPFPDDDGNATTSKPFGLPPRAASVPGNHRLRALSRRRWAAAMHAGDPRVVTRRGQGTAQPSCSTYGTRAPHTDPNSRPHRARLPAHPRHVSSHCLHELSRFSLL